MVLEDEGEEDQDVVGELDDDTAFGDLEDETTVTAKPMAFMQKTQGKRYITSKKNVVGAATASKTGVTMLDHKREDEEVLFYKQQKFLKKSVIQAFDKQYGPENKDILMKRLLCNQTIKPSSQAASSFDTPESILNYLEKNSNYIRPVTVKELARGGEAVVYRIEHAGLDEVVAKCSLSSYLDIMEET